MRIKCLVCDGKGSVLGDISRKFLPCYSCNGLGYYHNSDIDYNQYRVTDGFRVMSGFYHELCKLDKRMWSFVPVTDTKPLLIETSLCNLFNSYFGFNLLRHPVNSLHDLEGYYV